jgi:hypothetical protein
MAKQTEGRRLALGASLRPPLDLWLADQVFLRLPSTGCFATLQTFLSPSTRKFRSPAIVLELQCSATDGYGL